MSRIAFRALGDGTEIGANSYLVRTDDEEVILDCGLHPKKEGWEATPDLSKVDGRPVAVLVSHAHVDHCGAVPLLLKQFPEMDAYATEPTVSIMDRMLHNSVSVMGTLALERGIREYPLYSHRDVDRVIRRMYGLGMNKEFALAWKSPIRASFHYSGHVLGSASILLKLPGHTLLYTGDVCTRSQELMAPLRPLDEAIQVDTLVMEATRGAHEVDGTEQLDEEIGHFAQETRSVLLREGVVLVPAFALGRTQEILNILSRLMRRGKLPEVPIYASGLGRAVYEVYSRFTEYLKPNADLRPLYEFKRIGDVWERSVRRELLKSPCIIVATSGMMVENTPSAMIAQDLVQDEKNGIFFVGYLDPETLGYKVLHANVGDSLAFELDAKPIHITLQNRRRFNFSAHAHRDDLRRLANRVRPKNIIFVHGDADAVEWMSQNVSGDFEKHIPIGHNPVFLDA